MIGPSKVVSEGDDEKTLPSSSTTQMYVVSLATGGAPLAARGASAECPATRTSTSAIQACGSTSLSFAVTIML